ncbi:MAG: translation initiation factor [Candidatus Woesearchaeota archaeon]|jgi:translation initiation factor 1|nr:translation initiation factor [Candidatus Woesearchaeota archaeon]MDP7181765.1 translation initiation factor [Candidatus Woesearchaeota archaeon]MDP7198854.1 translation initiation factor [Candidatus Woesearchaeota archaeon]MDP7467146.1 translation initiation factor [Candidatus Woesearchaeota archaeon]MDP7647519.1 translation initiation factor [Candidatus Woesearchaeota archaeon]|tara:strand:- start:628 stop:933 length:306 start_codon:yes stop_codon:yes gene_type:complete
MNVCERCGLPQELCVCESIAKETQKIVVTVERKKFRREYTIISGIDDKEIDMDQLAKKLKNKFACGGTVKNRQIELQGNHSKNIKGELVNLGFAAETIIIK